MATEKTKKLLDKLNGITANKDLNSTDTPRTIPTSNKIWTSVVDMYNFPKHYDKAKKHKEVDDDGREDSWFYIDRIYGGLNAQRLIQADGSEYPGKIYDKRMIIKKADGTSFYARCHMTADGRWFDGSGMPMLPLTGIENDNQETKTEDEEEAGSEE